MIALQTPFGMENLFRGNVLQENFVHIIAARVLNSLPAGILIAAFVWLVLRLLPRQNSGTRFAVWFLALIAVAALPFSGGLGISHFAPVVSGSGQPLFTISTTWAFVLLFTWALFAMACVLRLAIGIVRLHRLLRTCTPIDLSELQPAIGSVIAEFSASHAARLATSDKVNVPAAMGFINPTIVIPRWALRDMAPQELNAILLHEYAHLARHDSWTNLLQKFVRAVFFFHPAMWWIDRRLSLEREMACDDYVLAETQNPRAYAECLLALLERNFARRGWALAQAAVHHAREATLRMSQILDANRPKGRRVWKPAIALVGAFFFACVTVLPETRQLVQVAPAAYQIHENAANVRSDSLSLSPMAAVVPAALHVSTSNDRPPQAHRNSASNKVSTSTQWLAAGQARAATRRERIAPEVVSAVEVPTIMPVSETILVISTGQASGSSLQWSICVWRVTVMPQLMANVPASHKT
jgi:beta-lactamase regulating signal transducer with metallopeptidase domain